MPELLAMGAIWIALVVAIPIVFIGLAIYSVWQLRKPEGWEQK